MYLQTLPKVLRTRNQYQNADHPDRKDLSKKRNPRKLLISFHYHILFGDVKYVATFAQETIRLSSVLCVKQKKTGLNGLFEI
jgi:hypothetical protein